MRRIVILIATLTMLLLLVAPAAATPPTNVRIVATIRGLDGPFTATGPLGGAGPVCAEGWAYNVGSHLSAGNGPITAIQVDYLFICGDLSGDFTLSLNARFGDPLVTSLGNWRVVDGDGAYETLRGSGQLQGFYGCLPLGGCIDDTYTGRLYLD